MRASVLLFFAIWAFSADLNIGKVVLGTTQKDVRATESGEPLSVVQAGGETLVRYPSTKFLPKAGTVQYAFRNDLLTSATYIFTPEHADPNEFVADFHAVEAKLRPALKTVSCERAIWLDNSLQNESLAYLRQDRALPSDIRPYDVDAGLSIALGHVQLVSVWNTPSMQIVHSMTGANRKILHTIEYRPLNGDKSDLAESCETHR